MTRVILLETSQVLRELSGALCAVVMFILPGSCLKAARKGGIVSDFGCWFWINVDGLTVCQRHQRRPIFAWGPEASR